MFHQQICVVAATGIPISLGFQHAAIHFNRMRELEERLFETERELAEQLDSESDLRSVLSGESSLPDRYRNIALGWLGSDRSLAALEPLVAESMARNTRTSTYWLGSAYPAITLLIATLAFNYVLYGMIPTVEAIYQRSRLPVGSVAQTMVIIRTWLPVWLPVLALVIAAMIWRAWWRACQVATADSTRLGHLLRKASTADRLAAEFASSPASQGAELDRPDLSESMPELHPEGQSDSQPELHQEVSASLKPELHLSTSPPSDAPLLDWARFEANVHGPKPLSAVGDIYRSLAEHEVRHAGHVLPGRLVAIVGGILALGIGLSVFGPIIELFLAFGNDTGR